MDSSIDIDFFNACKNKDEIIISKLIDDPELNVSYIGENNNTALTWLCYNKMDNQAIKIIDKFGIKCLPEHTNIYNMTALYYTCMIKNESLALKLLNTFGDKCNVNIIDNYNNVSVFYQACNFEQPKVINFLIDMIDKNSVSIIEEETKNTALILLCYNNMNEQIIKLINKFGIDCIPDQYNENGNSLLYYCCYNNNEEAAIKLLEIYTNKDDVKALNKSISNKMISVTYNLTILMEDVDKENILVKSIIYKNENLAIKLINNINIDINQETNNGFTLLMFACIAQLPDICLLLLNKEIDYNKINKYNKTALDYCFNGMDEVILSLLKKEDCIRDNQYIFRQYNIDEFDIKNDESYNFKGVYGKILKATIIKDGTDIILKQSLLYDGANLINNDISKELLLIKQINQSNPSTAVILYGFCITEKKFYLVLEPLKRNLNEYLNIIRILNYQTRNDLFKIAFKELLENVKVIHSLGIIHNDIKNENIMIKYNKVVLIDFGISEFIGLSPNRSLIDEYLATITIKAPDNNTIINYLIDNKIITHNCNRKTFSSDTYSIAVTILQGIFNSKLKYIVSNNKIYNNSKNDGLINDNIELILTNKIIIDSYGEYLYDLLCKMLDNDSNKRLSVKDALNHKYFISKSKSIFNFMSKYILKINTITTYYYDNKYNINYFKKHIINDYIHYDSNEIKNTLMELQYKDDIYNNYKEYIITDKYKIQYKTFYKTKLNHDLNSIINSIICMKNNNFNIKSSNDHICYYYLLIRYYSSIFNNEIDSINIIKNNSFKYTGEVLNNYLEIYNKVQFNYIPVVIYIEYKVIELQKMKIDIETIKNIEINMAQDLFLFIVNYEDISITITDLIDVLFKYNSEKNNIVLDINVDNYLYHKVLSFLINLLFLYILMYIYFNVYIYIYINVYIIS